MDGEQDKRKITLDSGILEDGGETSTTSTQGRPQRTPFHLPSDRFTVEMNEHPYLSMNAEAGGDNLTSEAGAISGEGKPRSCLGLFNGNLEQSEKNRDYLEDVVTDETSGHLDAPRDRAPCNKLESPMESEMSSSDIESSEYVQPGDATADERLSLGDDSLIDGELLYEDLLPEIGELNKDELPDLGTGSFPLEEYLGSQASHSSEKRIIDEPNYITDGNTVTKSPTMISENGCCGRERAHFSEGLSSPTTKSKEQRLEFVPYPRRTPMVVVSEDAVDFDISMRYDNDALKMKVSAPWREDSSRFAGTCSRDEDETVSTACTNDKCSIGQMLRSADSILWESDCSGESSGDERVSSCSSAILFESEAEGKSSPTDCAVAVSEITLSPPSCEKVVADPVASVNSTDDSDNAECVQFEPSCTQDQVQVDQPCHAFGLPLRDLRTAGYNTPSEPLVFPGNLATGDVEVTLPVEWSGKPDEKIGPCESEVGGADLNDGMHKEKQEAPHSAESDEIRFLPFKRSSISQKTSEDSQLSDRKDGQKPSTQTAGVESSKNMKPQFTVQNAEEIGLKKKVHPTGCTAMAAIELGDPSSCNLSADEGYTNPTDAILQHGKVSSGGSDAAGLCPRGPASDLTKPISSVINDLVEKVQTHSLSSSCAPVTEHLVHAAVIVTRDRAMEESSTEKKQECTKKCLECDTKSATDAFADAVEQESGIASQSSNNPDTSSNDVNGPVTEVLGNDLVSIRNIVIDSSLRAQDEIQQANTSEKCLQAIAKASETEGETSTTKSTLKRKTRSSDKEIITEAEGSQSTAGIELPSVEKEPEQSNDDSGWKPTLKKPMLFPEKGRETKRKTQNVLHLPEGTTEVLNNQSISKGPRLRSGAVAASCTSRQRKRDSSAIETETEKSEEVSVGMTRSRRRSTGAVDTSSSLSGTQQEMNGAARKPKRQRTATTSDECSQFTYVTRLRLRQLREQGLDVKLEPPITLQRK